MSSIPTTILAPRFEYDPVLEREAQEYDMLSVFEHDVGEQQQQVHIENVEGGRFHRSMNECGNDMLFVVSTSSIVTASATTSLTRESEVDSSVIEEGRSRCNSEQSNVTTNAKVVYNQKSLRIVLSNRLQRISYQERCLIEDEIHGVSSMGLIEEKMTPHTIEMSLKKFREHLDHSLLQSQQAKQYQATMGLANSLQANSTHAYELCLHRNFSHAIGAGWDSASPLSDFRMMCLRTELWDPQRSCERFLRYLNALYSFYGERGLKYLPTLEDLNDRNRASPDEPLSGVWQGSNNDIESWKKMRSGSKTKRNRDNRHNSINMPEMQCIKSGIFQLLPSRDRAGRRVVVFQSDAGNSFNIKTMFKAMLYFFSTIALFDIDAQRDGLVFIVSIAPNREELEADDDQSSTDENNVQNFVNDCIDFQKALPVRFSAIHVCYDASQHPMLRTQVGAKLLKAMSNESSGVTDSSRIRLYDKDVSNTEVRTKLATFGIPVHELPVTPTGVIKHKHHNQWIKTQEWFERQEKQEHKQQMSSLLGEPFLSAVFTNELPALQISGTQSNKRHKAAGQRSQPMNNLSTRTSRQKGGDGGFILIECPSVNDVLFRQGGKFWNDQHKFQRGNLEFMELINSKVIFYKKTRSKKKKREIILEVTQEFATTSKGRFLENAAQLYGMGMDAPEGCWVELPLNSPMLHQKVRNSFINHARRVESRERQNRLWAVPKRQTSSSSSSNNNKIVNLSSEPTGFPPTARDRTQLEQTQRAHAEPREDTPMETTLRTTPNEKSPNQVVLKPTIDRDDERIRVVVDAIVLQDNQFNKELDEFFPSP
eukprot:jgi/Psemu1/39239/gm1.39239_g